MSLYNSRWQCRPSCQGKIDIGLESHKPKIRKFQHQHLPTWRIPRNAFPLTASLLFKEGNSNWKECKAIAERLVRLLIPQYIHSLNVTNHLPTIMESASSTTITHGIISESDIISGYQAFNERKAVRVSSQSLGHSRRSSTTSYSSSG